MFKNICQFNFHASVDPAAFWEQQLRRHAGTTAEVAGDLLAGYVMNRALRAIDGRIPYDVTVELWFRTESDRDQFLELLANTDDGFDDEVIDFCAYTVDEATILEPAHRTARA